MNRKHSFSIEQQRLIKEYLKQKGYNSEFSTGETSLVSPVADVAHNHHEARKNALEKLDEKQVKSTSVRKSGLRAATIQKRETFAHPAKKIEETIKQPKKKIEKSGLATRKVFLWLILSLIWWDLWFRIFVHKNIDFKGLLINTCFSLALAFSLTFIVTLFPQRWWRRLTAVPLVIIMIFFGAQYIYYSFFRNLFTWFSMTRGAQVAEFARDVIIKILLNIPVLLLIILPVIVFFIHEKLLRYLRTKGIIPEQLFNERLARKTGADRHNLILLGLLRITAAIVSFTFALLFVNIGDRSMNSAYDLCFESNDPLVASSKIGLMSAMGVDFGHFLFDKSIEAPDPDDTLPAEVVIMDSDTSTPFVDLSADVNKSSHGDKKTVVNPVSVRDHILPIDFESIIAHESNDKLRNMAQYFNDITPSTTNDHTGRYKGYNLIFITAESHSAYSAHPELTPTLWKLQEEGIKFKNFYNPVWGVSTSDGEYTGITGLAPKPGVWSMTESATKNMALVPGKMLQRLGYSTSAWHNHTYTYYGRDKSHPNLGYDTYKGLGNGIELKKTWPESDLEMMEQVFDEMVAKEPFHAYFMTVSGHMSYTFLGNAMATKNKDIVKDLPLNQGSKAYMGTQIELDRAMEYLLQRLREKGIADRTLIVINADHYPYGLEKVDYEQLAGKELDDNFEIYRNSLIMYVDGMEPEVVDKVCFTLDILPTIYNLMDIPFDSRLLIGSDIFSDREPLAFFLNRSWITDKGRYNSVSKEFIPAPGVTLENQEEYIRDITHIVKNKFKFSAQILDYDYYNQVLPDEIWEIANEGSGYPIKR